MLVALLVRIIDDLALLLNLLIVARVIISWVPDLQRNQVAEIIYALTEPVLAPFRRLFPLQGIDISPVLAIIVIQMARQLLVALLVGVR